MRGLLKRVIGKDVAGENDRDLGFRRQGHQRRLGGKDDNL
jgi:hypothetical protein